MKLNRRGFLSALGALATTAALPKVPSIPVGFVHPIVLKLGMNAIYGKMGKPFMGGRYERLRPGQMITTDIASAYPSVFERVKALRNESDESVYKAFQS
jgi:hypothetical protein